MIAEPAHKRTPCSLQQGASNAICVAGICTVSDTVLILHFGQRILATTFTRVELLSIKRKVLEKDRLPSMAIEKHCSHFTPHQFCNRITPADISQICERRRP